MPPLLSESPSLAALARGRWLLAAGQAGDAARLLAEALAREPQGDETADIAYHLGCALLAAGRPAAALPVLRRTVSDDRLAGFAWFQIAEAYARLGRPEREVVALRHVVRRNPEWVVARLRCGEALFRLGRTGDALAAVREVLRQDPRLAGAHRLQGVILCCRRQWAEAALAFAAWARCSPDDAAAELSLARARLLAGEGAAAEAAGRRALACDPALLRGHLLLARIALAQGRLQQAQNHLRNAVAAHPGLAALRTRLAAILLRRSQFEAASTLARGALSLDPENPAALAVLARCHLGRGELVRAQAMIAKLAQAAPGTLDLPVLRQELAARRRLPGPAAAPLAEPPVRPPNQPVAPEPVAPQPVAAPGLPAAAVPPRSGGGPATSMAGQFRPAVARPGPLHRPDLLDHLFIVRALILRDLRLKYRHNPFGVLMELVRPVAVMAAHYLLFTAIRKPMPGRIPIEVFIIAGFSVWFAFNYTAQGAIHGGRWPAGATGLPSVTRMHLRLARGGWAWLVNLVFCLVATLPLTLYGDTLPVPALPLTVAVFAIAGAMGFGFGLFMDQLGRAWPMVKPLEKLLTWALFVTSALYFCLATTKPFLAAILWYNPVLHLVEYERHAFDPGYPVALVSLSYPAAVAAGLLFAALAAVRSLRHRAQA